MQKGVTSRLILAVIMGIVFTAALTFTTTQIEATDIGIVTDTQTETETENQTDTQTQTEAEVQIDSATQTEPLIPNPFLDVDKEEITRLYQEGIVNGFPGQTYQPQQKVTRAEAAAMLGRALQLDGQKRKTKFPDVPENHYASGYIQSAVDAEIISGYPGGNFGLKDEMTREQMALLLTRAFNLSDQSVLVFSDVYPSHYTFGAINQLATSKITTGYPDGTFRPKNNITRLEFGLLLARALYPEYQGQTSAAALKPIYEVTISKAGDTNVYPDPSTTRAAIGKLPTDAETSIYMLVGTWAYVASDEIIGFIPIRDLKSKPQTEELLGKTIVLDPGHGGKDPGASANGIHEKNLVLDVGLLTRLNLQAAGANVLMTRDSDVFITLDGRVEFAEQAKASSFISIHANGSTTAIANGTDTFWNSSYSSLESKQLAEKIQKHLIESLQTRDRGVKQADFRVIKNTTMPSVLVELGFITNPAEAALMQTEKFQQSAASAILKGVLEFYK